MERAWPCPERWGRIRPYSRISGRDLDMYLFLFHSYNKVPKGGFNK